MAEDTSELPPSETKFHLGKRDLFKKIAKGVVVASGFGAWGKREVDVLENGLDTSNATYFPLYERHEIGIDHRNVPDHLDGFYKEVVGEDRPYVESPGDVFQKGVNIKDGLLDRFSNEGTRILIGDVDIGVSVNSDHVVRQFQKRALLGVAIGVSGYMYKAIQDGMEELRGNVPTPTTLSRRKFLSRGLIVAGGIIAAPSVMEISKLILNLNPDQKSAFNRIYNRLGGIVEGHMAPEDHLVFFRNLMMANKIMVAAEEMEKELGRKPKIAFNVGAAHSGLEDFLVAGHDFTRGLISLYPKEFWQEVIELNGGLENICGTRVLILPKGFNAESIKNPSTAESAKNNLNQSASDRIVIDNSLMEIIDSKFDSREEKEKRARDISEMKRILSEQISNEAYNQIEPILDKALALKPRDYNKIIGVIRRKDGDAVEFNITLPKGESPYRINRLNRSTDIHISRSTRLSGEFKGYQKVDFFLDDSGKLVKNPGRPDVVNIPQAHLWERVRLIFKGAPPDSDRWTYHAQGSTGANPMAGQAYLSTGDIASDQGVSDYYISQDGRLGVFSWIK